MRRLIKALRGSLGGSLSFRLTLNYGLLSILTTLILIAFIHSQVIDALRGEHARQITATAQRLTVVFEEQGRAGLIAAIELTLSDRIDADREVYLLLDERGQKLAGNLDFLPQGDVASHARAEEIFATPIQHNDQTGDGYLRWQALPDGATLVVGQDASEIADLNHVISQATAVALFLAACLVLLATYAFRRTLDYRIGQIRRTTQQIRAGQLSRRIPPAAANAEDDELALLNRDINAMLDRIEALMKNARHLSDTIAHNLRTPLTHISGALQSAQRAESSQAELLAANQTAIDGIARLNALLEKLLQIADMQAGIRRRAFKPCRLDDIAADVIEMYEALSEERGITLTRAPCDAVTVPGDANLLASAIANVVDNALKYAKNQVTIRVFRQGNQGCVAIEDNGPGLPEAEYAQLGKHFYRLDTTSDGHGLGLTSVLEIIKLHGGTLAFGNAGFGKTNPGLRVTVSLPYAPTPASDIRNVKT